VILFIVVFNFEMNTTCGCITTSPRTVITLYAKDDDDDDGYDIGLVVIVACYHILLLLCFVDYGSGMKKGQEGNKCVV